MPFDHFTAIAGLYDRAAQFNPQAQLIDLLDLPPGGVLMDAGGGTGRVASALRSMVREVVVVDLSVGMVRYAAKKQLMTTRASVEYLPFAHGSFDRIIMVDALHHVGNQSQAVSELWRSLAPGGKIVIIEPDIHKFTVKLVAFGEKVLLMHSHFLSAEKIVALLKVYSTEIRVISDKSSVSVCAERVREM
jgi:demethylmenaquinone methyltransferase/2-methoxy-6-polyprenyl-1,4-benzoquinol methylase